MMRIVFALILFFHGIIHLMGFVKAFEIAEINELTQNIPKPIGVLWLLATLLFIVALGAFLLQRDWWWIVATLGVVLSQTLIFLSWGDAKYGTIANVIIVALIIFFYITMLGPNKNDIAKFLKTVQSNNSSPAITEEDLAHLPEIVQQYLKYSRVIGKKIPQSVRLKQTGFFRTDPKQKWMPLVAEEYYITAPESFLWFGQVKPLPFLKIIARDSLINGKGNVLVKIPPFITIGNLKGKEADEASLLRYLNEMMWFPAAYLSDNITWKSIDDLVARATLKAWNMSVSANFHFDEEGKIVNFTAKRHRDNNGTLVLSDWETPIYEYAEFEGFMLPSKGNGLWKLTSGDFSYIKLEIVDIEYDNPTAY